MPLLPMGAVLLLMGLFSLTTAWRLRLDMPATQMEFLAHLLADLTAFAVLVFFSGGVTNPFVSLMLVPVVIAAISLRPRWVWLLAAVAGVFYGLLLLYYRPLAVADPVAAYGMHLAGMWFNFLISAGLIAFFVTRMHAALRARDQELSALREKQLRDERIVALGTQAALAAHELATPLATIQTTAHELAREFANDPDIGADCHLLEKQAQACKLILTQLAARAQDSVARITAARRLARRADRALAGAAPRRADRVHAASGSPRLHPARGTGAGDPECAEQCGRRVAPRRRVRGHDRPRSAVDRHRGSRPRLFSRTEGAGGTRAVQRQAGARLGHGPRAHPRHAGAAGRHPDPGRARRRRHPRAHHPALETLRMNMKLLIVEDDVDFAAALSRAMNKRGVEVAVAHDAAEARTVADAFVPSHAVVDLKLPGESGLTVVAALAARTPAPAIVVLTGYASIATAVEAVRLGARHYLAKPADADEILAALLRDQPDAALEVSPEPLSVARLEWEHIQKVLNEHDGNISATARALKMHRRTLQRKLDKRPPKAG